MPKFGSVPKHAPSHLFRQNGILYFRMSIPSDLRPIFDKREFRYSLGSGYLHEARRSAMNAAVAAKKIFAALRRQDGEVSGMSKTEIQTLADRLIRKSLDEDMQRRIQEGKNYQGQRFRLNIRTEGDLMNLTDMWKASGRSRMGNPTEWSRKEGSKFIHYIARDQNTTVSRIYKTKRGKWRHLRSLADRPGLCQISEP